MKKTILYASLIFVSVSFAAVINWPPKGKKARFRHPKTTETVLEKKVESKTQSSEEGMEDDAIERMRWELKRLMDPATGKIPDNVRMKELAYAATLPNDSKTGLQGRGISVWSNRGPWNVGGRTRAFGVDVGNEKRLLAGSCSGGMWVSTDGGLSWNQGNTKSQLKNATCLIQDTRTGHRNVWYYGSGEGYGASPSGNGAYYLGDGLFKSTDSGNSWTPIASTAGGLANTFSVNWQICWNLAMDPTAPDTAEEVYAATIYGIQRSVDGGKTWTTQLPGNSYTTDVAVTSTGVVYATINSDGNSKGIWRSNDGITYTQIKPANFPAKYTRITIGINPNNENEVYFLANTPGAGKVTKNYLGDGEWNSFYKYTFKSGNGSDTGGIWQDLSANLPNSTWVFDRWQTQQAYDMIVRVKPGSPNTVFIGGTNVYRSTSGFQDSTHTSYIGGYEQFSKLPIINGYKNHHPDQHCIAFSPVNPDIMFSSNDGGVFKTLNNSAATVSWESLNNGYLTSMFYTVAIDHATPGNNVIIGGAQDNGSWFTNTPNSTTAWVSPRGGDGSYCAIADNRSAYYFSIQNGKMVRTTLDGNGNKTSFTRIDPIGIKGVEFINPYTLDPNNNNIMYLCGGKYLWRNDNLSTIPMTGGWDSISTNWVKWADSVPTASATVTSIGVCKTPANRVYIGTSNKRLYKIDNANIGTPKMVDITSTTSGVVFPSSCFITSIAVDPNDGNKLMVVFSNYGVYSIFYSGDAGASWSKQGGNLEPSNGTGPSIRWASIIPVSGGNIYMLATSTGIYATTKLNGTQTIWTQQGTDVIGNAVCDMIDYRISDGYVVVATHANGIFSANFASVNDIASTKDIGTLSTNIDLKAYPNPASEKVNIGYKLTGACHIKMELWDECGRVVTTPRNTFETAGEYSVPVDVSSLTPGVYYINLESDKIKKTIQVLVSR